MLRQQARLFALRQPEQPPYCPPPGRPLDSVRCSSLRRVSPMDAFAKFTFLTEAPVKSALARRALIMTVLSSYAFASREWRKLAPRR
jgi:hypothetical protein